MPNLTPPTYDEKQLEIIKRGAISSVVLQPLTHDDAIAYRMRLYRTKDNLIHHQHELAACAKLITIRVKRTKSAWALIIEPRDKGFEQAFLNAGITAGSEPPDLE